VRVLVVTNLRARRVLRDAGRRRDYEVDGVAQDRRSTLMKTIDELEPDVIVMTPIAEPRVPSTWW